MNPALKPVPMPPSHPKVRALPFEGSDEALVHALRLGHPGAKALLYDRYRLPVRRVLARVLGVDQELPDVMQEVFMRALSEITKLEHAERLGAWLISIAVFTARGRIRKRRRQRWLSFWAPDTLPEIHENQFVLAGRPAHFNADDDARLALKATYRALEKLPTEERIVFALRFLDGMELREVAQATELSLATVKRRLGKAVARFESLARRDPGLADWVGRGVPQDARARGGESP